MAESIVKNNADKLRELQDTYHEIFSHFHHLKINETDLLTMIKIRKKCDICQKSRKFFCYTCYCSVIDHSLYPRVKLPIKIDIIKHPREVDGKSTAVHATILAPEDVKIYMYPDFPEISNKEETVLVFPGKDSVRNISVEDLFSRQERKCDGSAESIETVFPVKRAIFIDSTWQQAKSMYKDQRLTEYLTISNEFDTELRCVILRSKSSLFWRHQRKSPNWYLATIESIHQFLVELHTYAFGVDEDYIKWGERTKPLTRTTPEFREFTVNNSEIMQKYNGQYDNLLYFFKFMYEHIHSTNHKKKVKAHEKSLQKR